MTKKLGNDVKIMNLLMKIKKLSVNCPRGGCRKCCMVCGGCGHEQLRTIISRAQTGKRMIND